MSNTKFIFPLLISATFIYFGVAIVLQLYENVGSEHLISSDAQSYEVATKMLYNQNFKVHPSRPFGYPLLIGLPLLFTDNENISQGYILFIQFLMWLWTVVLIYYTLNDRVGNRMAFIAALIYAISISNIVITMYTLSETAYILFLTLFVYSLNRYLASNSISYLILCLLFICYSTIIRSISFYIVLLFIPIAFYLIVKSKKKILLHSTLIILIVSSTLGLQSILNYQNYKVFTVSMIGKQTVYFYLATHAESLQKGIPISEAKDERMKTFIQIQEQSRPGESYRDQDKLIVSDFKYQLSSNTFNLFLAYAKNLLSNTISGSGFINKHQDFHNRKSYNTIKSTAYIISFSQNVFYILLLAGLLVYFFVLFVKKRIDNPVYIYSSILLIISAYFFMVSGISFWQADRFNITFTPLLIIVSFIIIGKMNFHRG